MIKKLLLAPAILSVAVLLMAADSAFAQRGGHGGGHGGGHVAGGHVGGGHVGGGHYGGYNHRGYGYYPGIFGGYYPWYDNWYSTYDYPRYSYYSPLAIQYYEPPTQYYVQPAPAVNDYANIRVIVPDPQARVWFDGNATSQTGTDRLFHSPLLTIGSTYSYQIRASWMQGGREVTQEKTVSATPGQTTVVDFTR